MKSSEREDALIHELLKQSSFVTVADMAEHMHLSSKTLYRLIKKINEESETVLIEAEKGKGIRLNYNVYLSSRFHQQSPESQSVHYNFSPIERRLHIMKELLFHAPLSLKEETLFSRYYLSPSAIYTDEDIINQNLQSFELVLQKNSNRLSVAGAESNIRKALMQILAKLNLFNFDDLQSMSIDFNKNNLRFVIRQLEFIEKEIDSIIPAPYNVNLLTHLYILIYRSSKGDFDHSTDKASEDLKKYRYYNVAKKVTENIEGYLCKKLPETETANICSYLNGSRIEPEQDKEVQENYSEEVQKIVDFFVQKFAEALHQPIVDHSLLAPELSSHIRPLLNRLHSGLTVKNPLLDDICQEYAQVFNIVREISTKASAEFHLPVIDDDEVGFITLYFARYLEQHPQRVRTLIVCTTGLGTSELLRTKVGRFFPELDVVDTASTRAVTPAYLAEHQIDLILTTVKPAQAWGVRTILVNTLFIERDKQNVRQVLKELRGEKK